jgi:hypothetical protein
VSLAGEMTCAVEKKTAAFAWRWGHAKVVTLGREAVAAPVAMKTMAAATTLATTSQD